MKEVVLTEKDTKEFTNSIILILFWQDLIQLYNQGVMPGLLLFVYLKIYQVNSIII